MTYVVAEPCKGCVDTSCVAVCPVDCIYDSGDMLVIHPEECIDCGACEPECPTTAIFSDTDLPDQWDSYLEINRARTVDDEVPNITEMRPAIGICAS